VADLSDSTIVIQPEREASERQPTLDFLRGIAVIGVVTFHTLAIFNPEIPVLTAVLALGVHGVQLFFFVSALTMCYMWDRRSGESQPVLKFYIRRLFRIGPPFWLAMIGYLALFGAGPSYWTPDGIGFRHIAVVATFLHVFWPDTANAIVPGGWSIGVEMV
jgi:peptidoglycan/LPS O-acetylase OafA/YrhL